MRPAVPARVPFGFGGGRSHCYVGRHGAHATAVAAVINRFVSGEKDTAVDAENDVIIYLLQ